jgi:hypothetical protein
MQVHDAFRFWLAHDVVNLLEAVNNTASGPRATALVSAHGGWACSAGKEGTGHHILSEAEEIVAEQGMFVCPAQ